MILRLNKKELQYITFESTGTTTTLLVTDQMYIVMVNDSIVLIIMVHTVYVCVQVYLHVHAYNGCSGYG